MLKISIICTLGCHCSVLMVHVCYRCDGAAECVALQLFGEWSPHPSHPTPQQAGHTGTHFQAVEMEEKEKRKAEAELYR